MPRPALAFLAAAVCAALAAQPAPAWAQDTAIRLGQSLQLTGEPLEVTADMLEVDQATGTSVFTGNVLAIQGDLRMTAATIRVEYTRATEAGEPQRVDRLIASGGVTLVTPTEALEAREAIYTLPEGALEMTGDVVLVQGQNVLSGQRLVANLSAGTGQMSGRVRTVIRLE